MDEVAKKKSKKEKDKDSKLEKALKVSSERGARTPHSPFSSLVPGICAYRFTRPPGFPHPSQLLIARLPPGVSSLPARDTALCALDPGAAGECCRSSARPGQVAGRDTRSLFLE